MQIKNIICAGCVVGAERRYFIICEKGYNFMNNLNIEILKEFGINEIESIQNASVSERESRYVNSKYFLKKFTDFDDLEKMLFINTELYQAGIPVAKYYKTNARKSYVEINNEYYTLAEKISGSHDECEIEAFVLGQNIAKLHIALIQLSDKSPYPKVNKNEMNMLKNWAVNVISEKKLAIRKEIIDYCINFDELYNSLPRQLIHNDLHRWKVLFENGEVKAFLDLEILQAEARLMDICYFMDAELDRTDNIKWFEILKSLLSGYNTVSELKEAEFYAVPYMFIMINLNAIASLSNTGILNQIDKMIENVNWFYDNKNKFSFSKKDIIQE